MFLLFRGRVPPILMGVASVTLLIMFLTLFPASVCRAAKTASRPCPNPLRTKVISVGSGSIILLPSFVLRSFRLWVGVSECVYR